MIETFGDMPSHPLLVHIPVVLVPVAAIGALACAVRTSWRDRYLSVVTLVSAVAFAGAVLAAQSGESLEESYEEAGQTISPTLHDHAELGERARLAAFVLLIVLAAWWAVLRWWRKVGDEQATTRLRKPRQVVAALAVVSVLAGAVATGAVITAGHSGADSVWESTGG